MEVFETIRTFLLNADNDYLVKSVKDEMQKILENEAARSWRNLLSVSNDKDWKVVRRETMIWSLNRLAASKFCGDLFFEKRVQRTLKHTNPKFNPDDLAPVLRFQVNKSSTVFSLHSSDRILKASRLKFEGVSSSDSLRVLRLYFWRKLEKLGDYENLQQLCIEDCPKLRHIGLMPNLTSLTLKNSVFTDFPVDNLIELILVGNTYFPMDRLNGLRNLRNLTLNLSFEVRRILKLPELEMLKVHFVSVHCFLDISELVGLQHFEIKADMNNTTILGKGKIYPMLTTLITPFDDFVDKNIYSFKKLKTVKCENFPTNYHGNLQKYLCIPETNLVLSEGEWIDNNNNHLFINDSIRSLSLTIPVKDIGIRRLNRNTSSLHTVYLMQAEITNLSIFSDAQVVVLKDCPCIKSISPLRTVPYLTLDELPRVKDFSCLGEHQKYLKIGSSFHLHNDVVDDKFQRINTLELENCPGVTKIDGLSENKFLSISHCSGFKGAQAEG
jgi:hypothetical protein